ncbi:MAG TPA: aldo/keto reductase [Gemmatimonadaceae bacterium]|nr:aldo/keto reductase [Gemmatimonadaceae bacterium]
MDKRSIGSLSFSVVGVGCNNFGGRIDEKKSKEVIDAALAVGINFFDTADMYANGKSEELLGRYLGSRRREAIVATKFGNEMEGQGRGARPEYVKKALDASLKRLRMDHVDLYQQHVPDPDVPIAETLGALDELVKAGKVLEIGCSNFSAAQLREARKASDAQPGSTRFVSVQNEYSLLHREPEEEVLAECEREGLAFLPFFPLMSGLLTGKYRKGQPIPQNTRVARYERYGKLLTEENLDKVEALIHFAESRGRTLLELAISWLLARRVVASVIAGATSGQQVRNNAAAADWNLTPTDLEEVDSLLRAAV